VNATTAQVPTDTTVNYTVIRNKGTANYKTASELLEQSSQDMHDRFEALKAFLLALGDDVQMTVRKTYFAFRRIKNFACVEVHPQSKRILIFVKIDPSSV